MDLIDDDPQLRDALHAATSGGPEAPSLDRLLLDAHRARRGQAVRRTAGGLAVAAALGAVAFTGAQLVSTGPGEARGDGVVATQPPETAQLDLGVHVSAEGKLVAEPGSEIVQTFPDPLLRRPDGRSWGVVVVRGGSAVWGLVDWTPEGTMTSVEPAGTRFAAASDWVQYEVAAQTGEPMIKPVAFAPDGTLRPNGSTRIVAQRTGVRVGQPDDDTMTAAAEIRVDGVRTWVLARLELDTFTQGTLYKVLQPDEVDSLDELVERSAEIWR